jgi:hypothetical protein
MVREKKRPRGTWFIYTPYRLYVMLSLINAHTSMSKPARPDILRDKGKGTANLPYLSISVIL